MAHHSGPCTQCGQPIWSTDREGWAVYLPHELDPDARFPLHPRCLPAAEARVRARRARDSEDIYMRIRITHTVLTGNMGDGWRDQEEAAHAYAAYLQDTLYLAAKAYWPKADIHAEVCIEDAEGWTPQVHLTGELPPLQHAHLEADLAEISKAAWAEFCDSATATALMI